jgi:hypothetical protein
MMQKGYNSIFADDTLLTADNSTEREDALIRRLCLIAPKPSTA